MNRISLAIILSLSTVFFGVVASGIETDIYVSPGGNDSNPGTKEEPLKSLIGAKYHVRQIRSSIEGDITVWFRGGNYHLDETVVFGMEDSGESESFITYAAYPGEEAVFSSGKEIGDWKKVNEEIPGLPDKARGNIWVASVSESFLTLSWDGRDDDGDDLSYDLYLDTQSNPKDLVAEELEDESFDVEELEDGETYYWKVVASDDRDETESEVRSFTVELPKPNRLPTVTLLGPANPSVVDHRGALILSWEAEDLDGDDLQYSILVELITDKVPEGRFPVALGLGQYRDTYELTELEPGQSYEWYVYISDEEGGTRSDIRTFTTTGSSGGNDDDDDDGFEIAGANGYAVAGGGIVLAVTLMAVFLVFRPGKDEDYDDYDEDYDDYEDDEDYYL